jgi:hypothetical protein
VFDLTDSETFRAMLEDVEYLTGEQHAERIFGKAWREELRRTSTGAPRLGYPKPQAVKRYLHPLLADAVCHDGRSTAEGRTTGWWVRTRDGWQPATTDDLIEPLFDVAEAFYLHARALHDAAKRADDEHNAGRPDHARRYTSDDAALRLAVFSALMQMLNESGSRAHTILTALREPLRMTEEPLADAARAWMSDNIDAGLIVPADGTDRVTARDVNDALRFRASMPVTTLMRGLDLAYGKRRKSGHDRYWTVPAEPDIEEDDAPPAPVLAVVP